MISLLTHDLALFTLIQRALSHIARERRHRCPQLVLGTTAQELQPTLDLSSLLILDCMALQDTHAGEMLGRLEAHSPATLPWALVLPPTNLPATLAPLLVRAGRREVVTVVSRVHAGNAESWVPYLRQAFAARVVERTTADFRTLTAGQADGALLTELFRVTPQVQTVAELPRVMGQQYRGYTSSSRTLFRRLQELKMPSPSVLLGLFRLVHYRHFDDEPFTQDAIARALSYPSAAALRRSFAQRANVRLADLRPVPKATMLRWCVGELYAQPPDRSLADRVADLCLTN